jgi:hypothetical protein
MRRHNGAEGGDDGENVIDSEPFTIEHNTEVVREMVPASPSPFPGPTSPTGGEHPGPAEEREFSEEDLDAKHDDTVLRLCAVNDVIGAPHRPPLHVGCWTPCSTSPLQMSRLRSVRRSKKSHGAKL